MMHYLESLLARATGAPETGRLVMPRPVSLFEPVSGATLEPPLAGDVGGAGADAYDQPDSNLPAPPIAGSAPVPVREAYDLPDRLTPRVRPHPSTDDTSSSVLSGKPAQDAPTGDDSLPTLSRTPAQDASRGMSPPPGVRRAAASNVQGPPVTRAAPVRGVDVHDQTDQPEPRFPPQPGAAHGFAAGRTEAENVDGVEVSTGRRARTPSAMDAYTQPDRLKPPLRAQPDTASVLAAGRAEGADVSGADGSATLGMDAYSEPDRLKPRFQSERDSGPEAARGRAAHPHPPVTPVAAGQRTAPTAAASSPVASPEAPPIVRVTIGRVEVRAVLPPPVEPPRSQRLAPPAPGPSLSLDDYLKQGRGGA